MNNYNFKGANQFKSKPKYLGLSKRSYLLILALIAFQFIVAIIGANFVKQEKKINYYKLKSTAYAQEIRQLKVVPEQLTEREQIELYIKQVFGKDSDKAFKVLKCENSSLNPNAVNTAGNYPAGSKDIGVFQINDHWQAVQGKFLKNWKVNIEIAYQIFKENGDFHLWTCGRRLGI